MFLSLYNRRIHNMLILLYKSLFLTVKVCYMYLRQEYDQFKKMVNVQPWSYGCTREVAKHERSVRVARGDSRVRL